MNFEVGDVAWLKTGGPAMTVEAVDPMSREVRCTWFTMNDGVQRIQTHAFRIETLTSNDPVSHRAPLPGVGPDDKVYEEGDD